MLPGEAFDKHFPFGKSHKYLHSFTLKFIFTLATYEVEINLMRKGKILDDIDPVDSGAQMAQIAIVFDKKRCWGEVWLHGFSYFIVKVLYSRHLVDVP